MYHFSGTQNPIYNINLATIKNSYNMKATTGIKKGMPKISCVLKSQVKQIFQPHQKPCNKSVLKFSGN